MKMTVLQQSCLSNPARIVYVCLVMSMATSAGAALLPRLETAPGSGVFLAYYDDRQDITWAADAQIDGLLLNWVDANSWAAGISIGGIGGWRLPTMDKNNDGVVINCSSTGEAACLDNEYGYHSVFNGINANATGPFNNIYDADYWSSTASSLFGLAWEFQFGFGSPGGQGVDNAAVQTNAMWAVHDGDVGLVPVPAAVWLFGSGLLVIIAAAKRRLPH